MNYTYPQLVSVLPNALVVTDRFRIVSTATKAFNATRVRIMKRYGTTTPKYKSLKRYWKLLLKPNEHLRLL
ncbi:transposase [Levilactobacillus suantsaii]|uniref:Transposase IS204/IS1001/IS1096/IS1165 DDE domain-containing protein n=2 Tax=Levilactobacillus suantsaii TaxID=2292255 RepID=A0A4Q0VHU8_9LACO|nr:transposase [Levilactobacillus suantsaii]QMU08755.1 transposase [Levilactobacillus suantsaii]RXI78926.1 hypothetical protein DXH47_05290 [Levilactobacillus suantsaii]